MLLPSNVFCPGISSPAFSTPAFLVALVLLIPFLKFRSRIFRVFHHSSKRVVQEAEKIQIHEQFGEFFRRHEPLMHEEHDSRKFLVSVISTGVCSLSVVDVARRLSCEHKETSFNNS